MALNELQAKRSGNIVLIRHGMPDVPPRRVIDSVGFTDWVKAYEDAGLHPNTLPPNRTVDAARSADTVFTSTLPRSRQSAEALGLARVTVMSAFDEPILPVPALNSLRMPVGAWLVLCRLVWLAGLHGNGETYGATRARAAEAAEVLTRAAAKGGVALIGHGWINRFIGAALIKRGWQRRGGGSALWDVTAYMPPTIRSE